MAFWRLGELFKSTKTGDENVPHVHVDTMPTVAVEIGSANIGDAASATQAGVVPLAIRDDALSTLSDPEGDLVAERVDSTGAKWVRVTDVVPGTGATNLGKAQGQLAASSDVGVVAYSIERKTPTPEATADRYGAIASANGGLWTRGITPIPVVVTFSLDTSAYADGDLLADTQAIAGAVSETDGYSRLVKVDISDEDAQGIAMDIVILRNSTSLGTENSAPNITDANLRPPNYQGLISVAAADWKTISGAKVTTWTADGGKGMLVIPVSGGTSVHAALIARGAGTFTASGIVATFWFARD